MGKKKYYLGLDIGTDSVGYAVTDEEYNLLKFHGDAAWGTTIFDAGSLNDERRGYRSARRRLDRRQQRVLFVQELFAKEIAKIDERFFIRLKESYLFREEAGDKYTFFNDPDFSDVDYFSKENGFPTIHHLIVDLMNNKSAHDVRLVYLACAWLVAHRGHFLSNISRDNISEIINFETVFQAFESYFIENDYKRPWENVNIIELQSILKKKMSISDKKKELAKVLLNGQKPAKEISDEFPYSVEALICLMAGGTCKVKDFFGKDEYEELGSFSLGMEEEKHAELMGNIGEDYDVVAALRKLFDWAVLSDVIGNYKSISEAKVDIYNQHKKDLEFTKKVLRKYCSKEDYDYFFRATDKANYVTYTMHSDEQIGTKRTNKEDMSKALKDIIKNIDSVEECDRLQYEDMKRRLDLCTFLPKQKDTDNRVIPQQLYCFELERILDNAMEYLPFLKETDEDGRSVRDKLLSVFLFRIPYYVGPLNSHSKNAWIVRKAGKIYPWNFTDMVDLDRSEEEFIKKLTNRCTYLPDEYVLPKDSLYYHKFMVLNEINNLKINGTPISVELKQRIYNECFLTKKKVTRKYLISYLVCNGIIEKGEEDAITGIDEEIKSNLTPQIWFDRLLKNGLKESEVEQIIERSACAEDKSRLGHWLEKVFPNISEEDRKYICSLKIHDFGRLSRKFLCEFEGTDKRTGEVTTILGAMWNTNDNLMEILSERYTFVEEIQDYQKEYYSEQGYSLEKRMDDMYLSNTVKRSVYRTLAIVKDVEKAFGKPEKIFIEMTRGAKEEQKGKRTKSRVNQILDLYKQCKDEDVRLLKKQLEDMGDAAENRLQGEKLFLYYMQLGKCMYSGETIELSQLGDSKLYDVDHIYPQAFVKDDSILNNKVLVLSQYNGAKSNIYPINASIRAKQRAFWEHLKKIGLLGEEKFKRLVRSTPFTEEEKMGFIQRQLTETSQSAKAVAELLKEKNPQTQIVYCKARLTSEFRQEFGLLKSRTYNDLHHAVDAYLNIVTGNVYNMKFTGRFDVNSNYSVKTKTLFSYPVYANGKTIWNGESDLAKVKKIARKNTAHFTKYAYLRKGRLFKQTLLKSDEKLTPIKKDRDTNKYGGYTGNTIMFFIPVSYFIGKKRESFIFPVEVLYGEQYLTDSAFAIEYTTKKIEERTKKSVTDISFPMGMRPWKINTVLSLDGFRVCLPGISSGEKYLIAQPIMQFASEEKWVEYMKRLERLVEKVSENARYMFSEEFDKVNKGKNMELYDLYIDKLQNSIFKKRVASDAPLKTLLEGREKFSGLSEIAQAKVLLNIHQVFGRVYSGCDLSEIGGAKNAATTNSFSLNPKTWAKHYHDVRLIDSSVSGLWEKVSECNLLDIL